MVAGGFYDEACELWCARCGGVGSISVGLQGAVCLLLYHCATLCGRCTTRSQRWMHCFDALDNQYVRMSMLHCGKRLYRFLVCL